MSIDSTIHRHWPAMRPRDWKVTVTRDRADAADAAGLDATVRDGLDDRALVQACLAGHRDAFDAIVERHQKRVYQLCYRFAGNHEDASDLAQDVFIRAYRALHGFKGQSAFSTWLYRIAVNVCLNRANSRASRQAAANVMDVADRVDDRSERADALLLKDERAAEVRRAIAELPDKQRAALILRVYHDLPHDQIAAIVGTSVGAVKANFFHALANLRKRLQRS